MQHSDEDDDDFFSSAPSSNLAKLFGVPSSAPQKMKDKIVASQQSLRYVPSQNDENDKQQEADNKETKNNDWVLVVAKVVNAYKLVNQENVNQGKVGLALLSKLGDEFKIILYRFKNEALDTISICQDSKIFIKNDYLQFQSDSENFWSILFDNPTDRDNILDQIAGKCTVKRQVDNRNKPKIDPVQTDNKVKASLISRMAKVGQQVLINKDKNGSTSDDDSTDSSNCEYVSVEPIIASKKPSVQKYNFQQKPDVTVDGSIQMLYAEHRLQNIEIKMNISKLESKMDRVLDKIDLLNLQSKQPNMTDDFGKEGEILKLEEKNLQLKKENHFLRAKTHVLESDLNVLKGKSSKNEENANLVKSLDEKVKAYEKNIESFKNQHQEKDKMIENLRNEMKDKDKTIEELKKQMNELKSKPSSDNDTVKLIISNSFQKLCDSIDNEKIIKLVGQILKQETNKMLKE